MTNGERADRLVGEARQIAREMNAALDGEAWNLATRRAQEVLMWLPRWECTANPN